MLCIAYHGFAEQTMVANAKQIYADTVRHLPSDERFKLARLILQDSPHPISNSATVGVNKISINLFPSRFLRATQPFAANGIGIDAPSQARRN